MLRRRVSFVKDFRGQDSFCNRLSCCDCLWGCISMRRQNQPGEQDWNIDSGCWREKVDPLSDPIHPRAFRGFSRTRKERLLVGSCFPTTRIAWVLDLGDCATSDGENKGKSSKRWLGYAWTEAYMLLICENIAIYIFRFVQFFLISQIFCAICAKKIGSRW